MLFRSQAGLAPRALWVSGLRSPAVQRGVADLLAREGVQAVLCTTSFASVQLEEAGLVLGKQIRVNWKLLGYDVIAFIGIYLEKSSLYDQVARELSKIPQIVRLNYTTGNYSMFAEVVCKDINQMRFVLHDALQKVKGIERTETIISLEESFHRSVRLEE